MVEGVFYEKGYLVTAAGILGMGLLGRYVLSNRNKRNTIKVRFDEKNKKLVREYDYFSALEEAGIPDQLDHQGDLSLLENAKMVSEGSQYGVHYYNMIQDDNQRYI